MKGEFNLFEPEAETGEEGLDIGDSDLVIVMNAVVLLPVLQEGVETCAADVGRVVELKGIQFKERRGEGDFAGQGSAGVKEGCDNRFAVEDGVRAGKDFELRQKLGEPEKGLRGRDFERDALGIQTHDWCGDSRAVAGVEAYRSEGGGSINSRAVLYKGLEH